MDDFSPGLPHMYTMTEDTEGHTRWSREAESFSHSLQVQCLHVED